MPGFGEEGGYAEQRTVHFGHELEQFDVDCKKLDSENASLAASNSTPSFSTRHYLVLFIILSFILFFSMKLSLKV